mmetsp:Transcript_41678/g.73283  ORF Transcript_41678/g.73283 Transcript_41678/m.73283 type:complete len:132 (+) Transcript_41678:174-569(+)
MDRDESSYDCSDDEADSLEPSDDCFDEPAVTRHDAAFAVLDEEACLALASKVVEEVSVLLCCGAEVAHSLLRSFKWDRERLIEGGTLRSHPSCRTILHSPPPFSPVPPHAGAPPAPFVRRVPALSAPSQST